MAAAGDDCADVQFIRAHARSIGLYELVFRRHGDALLVVKADDDPYGTWRAIEIHDRRRAVRTDEQITDQESGRAFVAFRRLDPLIRMRASVAAATAAA